VQTAPAVIGNIFDCISGNSIDKSDRNWKISSEYGGFTLNLSVQSIAERMRVARETAGMSTRMVSRKLKERGLTISHMSLSNYETAKLPPTVALIDALAALYGLTREWFLNTGPMLSGIRYRALKAVRVADKRAFEGEALGWFQSYLSVEQAVNDPLEQPMGKFRVKPSESGAAVAKRLRQDYKMADYPIPSVMRLVENFGIHVIQLHTDARIDGIAAWLGSVPVVAVNQSLSNDRIRMNAAHELGHHLFEDCVDGATLPDEEVERRAMEFASHVLIPDAALRTAFELQSMVRLVQYKERFGVSLAAMLFRAERTGLLSKSLAKTLWIKFGELGWRKNEPGYVPPDRPIRMESLFDAAVQQKKMTFAEIAATAGVDARAVRQRVFLAMGGSPEAFEPQREGSNLRIDQYFREQSTQKEL
jgi:Zn-dependent peptidase ImmA (M78 family)